MSFHDAKIQASRTFCNLSVVWIKFITATETVVPNRNVLDGNCSCNKSVFAHVPAICPVTMFLCITLLHVPPRPCSSSYYMAKRVPSLQTIERKSPNKIISLSSNLNLTEVSTFKLQRPQSLKGIIGMNPNLADSFVLSKNPMRCKREPRSTVLYDCLRLYYVTWYWVEANVSGITPNPLIPILRYSNQTRQLEGNQSGIGTSFQTRMPAKNQANGLQRRETKMNYVAAVLLLFGYNFVLFILSYKN